MKLFLLQAELKDLYKIQHEKHTIHKVDSNRRIVMKEVKVVEFAVKLKISNSIPPACTFKDERRRHFEHFKCLKDGDIEPSDLVNGSDRVIFIRGIAGMGKTTLSKQLAYGWANGKIYTSFKLCIIVECRDINCFVLNEGETFRKYDLFDAFLKTKFDYDLKCGEGTLFIFDGLDELYDICQDDSIINQLLDVKRSKYAMSKIIITGRPHVESMLERKDTEIGGLRKVEIQGLSDDQIEDYINKFATCEEDLRNIKKAKDSSRRDLQIVYVPQFLNSLCCVAILSEGKAVRNAAELYCWTLYLLFKQHADRQGPSQKRCSEIFAEYSRELVTLSNLCHKLLNENKIIFEGSLESRLCETGKGKAFLEGLFIDVSDNRIEKHQFKHLSLMEFLSAVHICSVGSWMEAIEKNLKQAFYEVVLFICQLISGYQYKGVIRDMFVKDEQLRAVRVKQVLLRSLELILECVDDDQKSFQLSIDIIICFLNTDIPNKMFLMSVIKLLRCDVNLLEDQSIKRVSEISDHLVQYHNFTEEDLKESFKHVFAEKVRINDISLLVCVKYLGNARRLDLYSMNTKVRLICNEVSNITDCKQIQLNRCVLDDDDDDNDDEDGDDNDAESKGTGHSKLELLEMYECKMTKKSFTKLCNWAASSVKEFILNEIDSIECGWWKYLQYAIVNARAKGNENLALRTLCIRSCTQSVSKNMEKKVTQ